MEMVITFPLARPLVTRHDQQACYRLEAAIEEAGLGRVEATAVCFDEVTLLVHLSPGAKADTLQDTVSALLGASGFPPSAATIAIELSAVSIAPAPRPLVLLA